MVCAQAPDVLAVPRAAHILHTCCGSGFRILSPSCSAHPVSTRALTFWCFFFLFLKSPRVWTKTKTIYTILCKHKNTQVISLNYSSLKPAYSAGHASKGLQQQLGSCKAQEHISECSWNPLYTPAKQPGELHTEKILSRDPTSQGNSKDVQVLTCKNSLTPTNLGWLCAD